MIRVQVVVQPLEDPARHTVEELVLNVPSPVVKEDGILPAFADVASISWRDLPACHVVLMEQVELLVAKYADQDQLLVELRSATDAMELSSFQAHAIAPQIRYLLLLRHDIDLTLFSNGLIRNGFMRRRGVLLGLIQALLLNLRPRPPVALPDHKLIVQLSSHILPDPVTVEVDGLQCERLEKGRADV